MSRPCRTALVLLALVISACDAIFPYSRSRSGADGAAADGLTAPDGAPVDGPAADGRSDGPPADGATAPAEWIKRFSAGGSVYDSEAGQGVAAAHGRVCATGYVSSGVDFGGGSLAPAGDDIFIACYDSGGAHEWSDFYGALTAEQGTAVALFADGGCALTGRFAAFVSFDGLATISDPGGGGAFASAFDASGVHRWSAPLGGTGSDSGRAVAVDGAANAYVVGYFTAAANLGSGIVDGAGSTDAFLTSFAADGKHRWAVPIGGALADEGTGVAVDGAGNVYVAGTFIGPAVLAGTAQPGAGQSDGFVASFTSTGTPRWSAAIGGAGSDRAAAVAVDGAGNVYVAGALGNAAVTLGSSAWPGAGGQDGYVASFTGAGAPRWLVGLGGAGEDAARGVAVDGTGHIFVAGDFEGSATIGSGLSSAGRADVFVVALDPLGAALWARRFGGGGTDRGEAVAVDGAAVYVTGSVGRPVDGSQVDLGDGPANVQGASDIYLLRLAAAGPP